MGSVGHLSRAGDLGITAADRILSARRLDEIVRFMRAAEQGMTSYGATAQRQRAASILNDEAVVGKTPTPRGRQA